MLALIAHLGDFPNDPMADHTRQLVDLGLLMCEGHEDQGIVAKEGDRPDSRHTGDSGAEVWRFVRTARDDVWQKAGLDPRVLRCPMSVGDIGLDMSCGRTCQQGTDTDSTFLAGTWPEALDVTGLDSVGYLDPSIYEGAVLNFLRRCREQSCSQEQEGY